ncbi:MAG: tetratricopeptide repeat protein [Bacteroidetes bacterium]|nr:tetratricopeptide repeat protein [Bacteroidota bacterium]
MSGSIVLFTTFCSFTGLSAQGVEDWVNKGLKQDSAGQSQQAVESFSKAIELEPDLAVIWYNRGVARMHLKQASLAVVDFNKAVFLDTSLTDAYFNRHLAYKATSNYMFAMADLDEYLKRRPGDVTALDARADLAIEMKEFDVARKDLETLHTLAPENASLLVRLAELCSQTGDHPGAEKWYNELLSAYPDEVGFYLSRAYVRTAAGNYSGSMDDINLYLLRQPRDAEALKLKADNYFYNKQFTEAEGIYTALLGKDSSNGSLWADYGHCLLQRGEFVKAEEILTRSIRSKADSPGYAYLGRGMARYNQGKTAEACQDWEKGKMLGEKRASEYLDKHCKK